VNPINQIGEAGVVLEQLPEFSKSEDKSEDLFGPSVQNDANPMSVVNAVEDFLNLGNADRLGSYSKLSDSEKEKFAKMLGKLLQSGIIGYEILEVNGQKEKHFLSTQIGDERLYNAKRYNKKGYLEY
jgi:hypothetical protein